MIRLVLSSLALLPLAQAIDPTCAFSPSLNASIYNYPSSPYTTPPTINLTAPYPYDLDVLSAVPIATICASKTQNSTEELACARRYIDAIDEQLAFLYARRLGYAAVAGAAKYRAGTSLDDPSRNTVVAEGMAARVARYGGQETAGRVLGGEGCMIYASLGYEVERIKDDCDAGFSEDIERKC